MRQDASFQLTPSGPPLCRCCPASSKSRGWYSSPLTGRDSLWSRRVCCCTCRSVEMAHYILLLCWFCFPFYFMQKYIKKTLHSFHWSDFYSVFRCLLQPLSWQQPYVPVLSRGMLDFVMAPTAFLMGCHISHFEEVAAVSTAIHRLKLQTVSSLSNRVFLAHGECVGSGCVAFWDPLISVSYPNSRSSYLVVFQIKMIQ